MADTMKSKTVAIGTSSTDIISAVSGGTTVVTMLQLGNVDGTDDATVDITLDKNGAGAVTTLKTLTIPAGKSVVLFSSSSGKLFLEDNGTPDVLAATANAAGDVVALLSYIERI